MPRRKVLITRPLAAAEPLAKALAQKGYDPIIAPLLDIAPLPFTLPASLFDAVLITSANAIPALAHIDMSLPVLTVGKMTAKACCAAGHSAKCIGQTIEEAIPQLSGHILYLSGQDISYDVPGTVRVPVYVAQPRTLEKATIALLSDAQIDWIVLFSRRTAAALAQAIAAMGDQGWTRATGLVCISERTAEPVADLQWRDVRIAISPTEASLVEMI